MKYIVKVKDTYAHKALLDKTKFVRISKRTVRGKTMYFVQLIKEGIPPLKERTTKEGEVGIDIGTSTIAIVSKDTVYFDKLISDENTFKQKANQLRLLQRKMDRSKRSTNPSKFNGDGTINIHNKETWIYSNRYLALRKKYNELHRKYHLRRKHNHERLANFIISLGNQVKVEKMSFKGLQKRKNETSINAKTGRFSKKKRYGKSLLNYAPSMLLSIVHRKLTYHQSALIEIDTYEVKASQFNHIDQTYCKKQLSERWNDFNGIKVHRDLYSAFLIQHVKEDLKTIDIKKCTDNFDAFLLKHNQLF